MQSEYRFTIADAYTPETLPMARMAEYAAALAKLLGEQERVHFRSVEPGSAVLVAAVEPPVRREVAGRLAAVRGGEGPPDARKAFAELDRMLRRDNATGTLSDENGAVVVPFPGRDRPEPLEYGPFRQNGTLDGQVVRVGGKDDTVHVHLRDGPVVHTGLYCNWEVARDIARHFGGPTLRVHGTGTWFRGGDGTWELRQFRIADFEVLDDAPLEAVVSRLREAEGSHWNEVPDPVRTLLEERHGDGDGN